MEATLPKFLAEGTLLQTGKYRILGVLGHGGFGITYLADRQMFGKVAIKELFLNSGEINCSRENLTQRNVIPHFDSQQFEQFRQRFESEARTLYNLTDITGVVRVLDIFEENSTSYFAMEYLDGEKLEDYIKQRGKLSPQEGIAMVNVIGKTVSDIHKRNILHRDIKPANIIVTKSGRVVLIDFGIARSNFDDLNEHTTFHTRIYSPPEQRISKSPMGKYSDVYAIGATAYYVFTGVPPQAIEERITGNYEDAKYFVKDLPEHINAAITRSLEIKKEDRFQTVDEFLEALNGISHVEIQKTITTPIKSGISLVESIKPEEKTRIENTAEQKQKIDAQTRIETEKSIPVIVAEDKTIIENNIRIPENVIDPNATVIDGMRKISPKTLSGNTKRKKQLMVGVAGFAAGITLIALVITRKNEPIAAPPQTVNKDLIIMVEKNLTTQWIYNNNFLALNNDSEKTLFYGKTPGKWHVVSINNDTALLTMNIYNEDFAFKVFPVTPRDSMTLQGSGANINKLGLGNAPTFRLLVASDTMKSTPIPLPVIPPIVSVAPAPTNPNVAVYPKPTSVVKPPVHHATQEASPVVAAWTEQRLLGILTSQQWKSGRENFNLYMDKTFKGSDGKGTWAISAFKPELEHMTLVLHQNNYERVFIIHKNNDVYLELARINSDKQEGKYFFK